MWLLAVFRSSSDLQSAHESSEKSNCSMCMVHGAAGGAVAEQNASTNVSQFNPLSKPAWNMHLPIRFHLRLFVYGHPTPRRCE